MHTNAKKFLCPRNLFCGLTVKGNPHLFILKLLVFCCIGLIQNIDLRRQALLVFYMFKVNNRNNRTRCEICSKLTIKTPERRQLASFWCLYC